jgi:hypothetical protein
MDCVDVVGVDRGVELSMLTVLVEDLLRRWRCFLQWDQTILREKGASAATARQLFGAGTSPTLLGFPQDQMPW